MDTPSQNSLQDTSQDRIRLVQLTDLHLGAVRDYRLAGIPTFHSFSATLSHVLTTLAPDHLVLSGDLAAECEEGAYRQLADTLATMHVTTHVTTRIPVSCIPGNHDDPALLSRYFPCHDRELTINGWRLLLLDTQVAGSVAGNLSAGALTLVEQALSSAGSRSASPPTLVFMHHPPLSVGCAWLDQHQVANGPRLLGLLAAAPAVKGVFTGHVHQSGRFPFGHFAVHTTPSTCFQFTPGSRHFSIDELPPGLRVIDLYADGRFETEVIYLQNYPYRAQRNSSGY